MTTSSPDAYGQPLFDDMVERYVRPELERQRADGTAAPDELVFRFQVLFPEGGEPEVRLNHDVGGTVMATATRPVAAGEEVTIEDFSGISEYTPRAEDADVPHVSAFAHRDGWSLVYQFGRGGHSNRFAELERGAEFLATAEDALSEGRLGPFVDNAFSACELLAKAELLSSRPTVDLVLGKRSHGAVAQPYQAWAKLGNTEQRFAKLLKRLAGLRPAGRYGQSELRLNDPEEILAMLKEMLEHVRSRVRDGSGTGAPDVVYLYALREIRAGEVVRTGDFAIYPPR
ncbi:MAG: hypothetical protein ACXW0R_08840 [Gaiellaceae bacterium]